MRASSPESRRYASGCNYSLNLLDSRLGQLNREFFYAFSWKISSSYVPPWISQVVSEVVWPSQKELPGSAHAWRHSCLIVTCYYPLKAFKGPPGASGRPSIVFKSSLAVSPVPLELPCGQCIGCRLERSRHWAVRSMHEASLHADNSFLTLTYDDAHLPVNGSLNMRDAQLFLKRLRKFAGSPFKVAYCGEYGDRSCRPHYHALIFGFQFQDLVEYKKNPQGDLLYVSADLMSLWPHGLSVVGQVTFESAAYVARYSLKKRNGRNADDYYTIYLADGTTYRMQSEFFNMSRRPGIGAAWLEKYSTDVYPSDELVINGKVTKPPRYYDLHYEAQGGDLEKLKSLRKAYASKFKSNNTRDRLRVRETVKKSQLKSLKREL